jgi:hypothetical protein
VDVSNLHGSDDPSCANASDGNTTACTTGVSTGINTALRGPQVSSSAVAGGVVFGVLALVCILLLLFVCLRYQQYLQQKNYSSRRRANLQPYSKTQRIPPVPAQFEVETAAFRAGLSTVPEDNLLSCIAGKYQSSQTLSELPLRILRAGLVDKLRESCGSIDLRTCDLGSTAACKQYWKQEVFQPKFANPAVGTSTSGASPFGHAITATPQTPSSDVLHHVYEVNPLLASKDNTYTSINTQVHNPQTDMLTVRTVSDLSQQLLHDVTVICAYVTTLSVYLSDTADVDTTASVDRFTSALKECVAALAAVVQNTSISLALPPSAFLNAAAALASDMLWKALQEAAKAKVKPVDAVRDKLDQIVRSNAHWTPSTQSLRQCLKERIEERHEKETIQSFTQFFRAQVALGAAPIAKMEWGKKSIAPPAAVDNPMLSYRRVAPSLNKTKTQSPLTGRAPARITHQPSVQRATFEAVGLRSR